MNATFSNNFEHFFDLHYTLKIVYGTIFTLSEVLAFCSYSGFVYYEHYAGDPLKRSIKNKLISQCFLLMMGLNLLNNSGFAWRIIIGPLNHNIAILMIFIRQIVATVALLCITEIISFKVRFENKELPKLLPRSCHNFFSKVFMLYGWTYFCLMDEEFLSRPLLKFNILFALGTQTCRWMLGSFETHVYEVLTAELLSNSVKHSRIFWPIFLSLNCVIISIGCVTLVIKKYVVYMENRNR